MKAIVESLTTMIMLFCGSILLGDSDGIENGDFETGDFSGWTLMGNVFMESYLPANETASYAAHFNRFNLAPNGSLAQSSVAVPDAEYELTFDLGCLTYVGLSQRIAIEVAGDDVLISDSIFQQGMSVNSFAYTTYSYSFVADSNEITVLFSDVGSNDTTATDIILDNVRLELLTNGVIGDINCDGSLDLLDVEPFVEILSSGQCTPKADINQDGKVNLLDVDPFVALLSGN